MSSPLPETLKVDPGGTPTQQEVGEMYKTSYRRFVDGFKVQNTKIRYYCNKAISMRQPLHDILDKVIQLQQVAFSYVGTEPQTDQCVLGMVLTLICNLTRMIKWSRLPHKCYWEDFVRESRQLRYLLDETQGALLECCHTIMDKAHLATEILQDVMPGEKRPRRHASKLKETMFQPAGDPPPNTVKFHCLPPNETIIIQWVDEDDKEFQYISLQETGEGFQIRLLRMLIFYARKSLELISMSMLRIDLALRNEFQLEKLQKCDGVLPNQLLPHERATLFKTKKEFDILWVDILQSIARFRMQLKDLSGFNEILKRLAKDQKLIPIPSIEGMSFQLVEDAMIYNVVSQLKSEADLSRDIKTTGLLDRSEDFAEIIQNLWAIDKTNYKTMEMLVMLIYSALSHVTDLLRSEEQKKIKENLLKVCSQRDKVKKYMKKCFGIFANRAFEEMPLHKISRRTTSSVGVHQSKSEMSPEGSQQENDSDSDEGKSEAQPLLWVQLSGGFQVTVGEQKEFLVMNQFKERFQFKQLEEDEKVALTSKMITRLFHCMTSEACFEKILWERCLETKSLAKRLNTPNSPALISVISNGIHYIENMLKITNNVNVCLTLVKKF